MYFPGLSVSVTKVIAWLLPPGGIALTRRLLDALAIGSDDSVVEFARGLGATAQPVLERRPTAYAH